MDAYVVLVQFVCFIAKRAHKEAHEHGNFFLRPLPVFGGEGVKGEILDADLSARLNGVTNGFDAFVMSGDSGKPSFFCPSPVPVHDDRDMNRDVTILRELFLNRLVFR